MNNTSVIPARNLEVPAKCQRPGVLVRSLFGRKVVRESKLQALQNAIRKQREREDGKGERESISLFSRCTVWR